METALRNNLELPGNEARMNDKKYMLTLVMFLGPY